MDGIGKLNRYTGNEGAEYASRAFDKIMQGEIFQSMKPMFAQELLEDLWQEYGFVDGNTDTIPESIFMEAYGSVDKDSTPGYPFDFYSTNADVPLILLKEKVDEVWSLLHSEDFDDIFDFDPEAEADEVMAQKMANLFREGKVYPASVFVKSEPTGKSKIARLIYGDSLVMGIIARILFGSFITKLPKVQELTNNAIGIDFTSEEGIQSYARKLRSKITLGDFVVSDDVQGFEYMTPYRAWYAFCVSFIEALDIFIDVHPDVFRLYERYAKMTAARLVILSDGEVLLLPFFITLSGIYVTHAFNSHWRAMLATLDLSTYYRRNGVNEKRKLRTHDSNGDDNWCSSVIRVDTHLWGEASRAFGYVHTDVHTNRWQPGATIEFCSQEFKLFSCSSREWNIGVRPTGVEKSIYNLLNAVARGDVESIIGLMHHFHFLKLSRHQLLQMTKELWACVHGTKLELEMAG